MFNNVGWAEVLIICVAGLIILGPERLPGAIRWTMDSLRKVREYAGGATDSLKNEFGEDFDDLRKPLAQINELRGMTPKAAVTRHLLDGDTSVFDAFTGLPDEVAKATDGTARPAAPDPTPIKPVSTPLPAEPAPPADQSPRRPADQPSAKRPSVTDWDAT